MRAGKLDTRVAIQRYSGTRDEHGQVIGTWEPFVERWAAVERAPGDEVWASGQRTAGLPTVLRMRWMEGITPAMRAVVAGKVLNIKSVVRPTGRATDMLLVCTEEVGKAP